ncbi:hypothetical protein ACIP1T_24675 [Pseudomonas japonica]|uniref:hypothetical protein n=1 Tax=Pseudomonas japonica TaxID=256466 RepID=UPI0037FAAC07
MFAWIKFVMGLPPPLRLRVLWATGFGLTGLAIVFMSVFWQKPVPSSESQWMVVSGYVSTEPEPWSEDRSLFHFAVRYVVPEGMRDRAPAYSAKRPYALAQVKKGSKVLVDIEYVDGKVIVQRVRSVHGIQLFDPLLRTYVRQVENRSLMLSCSVFVVFGFSCLVAAAFLHFRKA